MAFTVITKEYNNNLYTIAYRHIPIFEIGVTVPGLPYYIQYIDENQQIFDTSGSLPKIITFKNVLELQENKIQAISDTIIVIHKTISEF